MSRVASRVGHKCRVDMVADALLRLLALESLHAARCSAADHFKQVGIHRSCLRLEFGIGLESTFILKQQIDTNSDTTVSAENAFEDISVVNIRLSKVLARVQLSRTLR